MKGDNVMFKHIFGNTFDFNKDGKMDSFERRAEYHAIMDEVRQSKGIEKPLSEMNFDELNQLAADTGIDPSLSGF